MMCFISSMPWVSCGQEKRVPAKEIYFPRGMTSFVNVCDVISAEKHYVW